MFLDIIHHPFSFLSKTPFRFYLKTQRFGDLISLHLQVKATQLGPIDRAIVEDENRIIDNVQKHNIWINVPLSQTFRSNLISYVIIYNG
jgi:hypothetical protein